MTNGASVKIIDPEFCAYASPGLDIGSLLSGFVLAYAYHKQRGGSTATATQASPIARQQAGGGPREGEAELGDAIRLIWSNCAEQLAAGGVAQACIDRIGEDSVGFCMMEVIRTCLGCAGARDPAHRIAEPQALRRYQRAVVAFARTCLLQRAGPEGGVGGMLRALEAIAV